MQRLPDDIVTNILSRLPVKKLLQFKCVCKLWHTTISDSQFAKLQLQQSSSQENINNGNNFKVFVFHQDSGLIFLDNENGNDQFAEIKLDFPLGDKDYIEFLGCCDGMLFVEYESELVLWNPSFRQYRKLPNGDVSSKVCSTRAYGFGFDSAADDYKVYRTYRESDLPVLEVFALKTNCWRRIEVLTPESIINNAINFLHGSLHWGSLTWDGWRYFAFGLASEKFLEVPLPDVPGYKVSEMVIFYGCLCVHCYNTDNSGIEIWIMKEYMVRASWTRLGAVFMDNIPNFKFPLIPLCYSSHDEILLCISYKYVVKYNMNERSCMNVFTVKNKFGHNEYNAEIEALPYVESLVSPIMMMM